MGELRIAIIGTTQSTITRSALGEIAGIPRVLDAGQCNDSYSLFVIAQALAQAFGVSVNGLPAFLSPNVVEVLVKAYDLKPIAGAEEDVQAILACNQLIA